MLNIYGDCQRKYKFDTKTAENENNNYHKNTIFLLDTIFFIIRELFSDILPHF